MGAGGVLILQRIAGNPNVLPLPFGFTVAGPWLPPVMHFTWENEEEKCRIQTRVQRPLLEVPRGKALYGSVIPENRFHFGEFLVPWRCRLITVVFCLFPFKKPTVFSCISGEIQNTAL